MVAVLRPSPPIFANLDHSDCLPLYIAFEVGIATSQYQRFDYGVCNLANGYLKHGLKICLLLELDPYELLFEGDVWGDE